MKAETYRALKCPMCSGRGTVGCFDGYHFVDIECPLCDGSCEITTEKQRRIYDACKNVAQKEPMTNEEWFCGLSTEEKVATLVDLHKKVRMKMRTEIGGENSLLNGDYHREWLKEKHNEMPNV